jgi:hypothetical protein
MQNGGRIIFPAKPASTHSSWKTSRCRFGGRIIFPAKPTSTHSSWKTSRCRFGGRIIFLLPNLHLLTLLGKQVDVGLAGKLCFPPNLHLLTHIGKQTTRVSRCRFGRINNSPANFKSTCFYSDFHAKQVDVKLAEKTIVKSPLNTPNKHQTYHPCCRQCCCCILHPRCRCLNLSPVQAPSLVALPLLCTVVSLPCLLILAKTMDRFLLPGQCQ